MQYIAMWGLGLGLLNISKMQHDQKHCPVGWTRQRAPLLEEFSELRKRED
jgi:hypothetical protein